jgi:hypothetical protein
MLKNAWERWKILNEILGDYHARAITTLFYFTLFVPFALGVRLLADPLHIKGKPAQWLPKPPVPTSLEDARRQF